MPALDLWMNGLAVGRWTHTRRGASTLTYDPAWRAAPEGRPLSLSLPFTAAGPLRGPAVDAWFDNLLPDSERIRARMAHRFSADMADPLSLLTAVGRDAVGAVQLLPPGVIPEAAPPVTSLTVTEADVAALLRSVPVDRGFGTGAWHPAHAPHVDAFRLSVAGAQEKTALLWANDAWHIPTGPTPTTHLLKLPLGTVTQYHLDMRHSVDNEWTCLALLDALHLPTATAAIASFTDAIDTQRVLVVERFDRAWRTAAAGHQWLLRRPQEDLCQATGTPSAKKYQQEGGPSIERLVDLLRGSTDPTADLTTFALAQLAFWLLAAPDGHAKNFSITLGPHGAYGLTPLYDVLSAWPVIGQRHGQLNRRKISLAMGLRGSSGLHYALPEIHATHFHALAQRTAVPGLFDRMIGMVRGVPDALHRVSTRRPADLAPQIWEQISAGVGDHAKRFLRAVDLMSRHAGR